MDLSVSEIFESNYPLMCIDDEYEIKGDFNTNTASNLMIVFELCEEE